MRDKTGEAIGALHHPEVGDIDLVWGEGKGLSSIAKDHPSVLDNLQERVQKTKVESRSDNRIILHDDDTRAVIRLDYNKKAKTWLMTAYTPDERVRRLADTTERRKGYQADTSSASPDKNNIIRDVDNDKDSFGNLLNRKQPLTSTVQEQLDHAMSGGTFGRLPSGRSVAVTRTAKARDLIKPSDFGRMWTSDPKDRVFMPMVIRRMLQVAGDTPV